MVETGDGFWSAPEFSAIAAVRGAAHALEQKLSKGYRFTFKCVMTAIFRLSIRWRGGHVYLCHRPMYRAW